MIGYFNWSHPVHVYHVFKRNVITFSLNAIVDVRLRHRRHEMISFYISKATKVTNVVVVFTFLQEVTSPATSGRQQIMFGSLLSWEAKPQNILHVFTPL